MERKETFVGEDGRKYCFVKRQNRNATLESLEAVVKMILADNEQDFCRNYALATHDNTNGGHTVWYYLTHGTNEYYKAHREEILKDQKRRREERKAKIKINIEEDFNFE